MSKGSSDAPNYAKAAQAQSEGSVQAALVNALLNMRNTNTPLGSQTFTQSGSYQIPGIGKTPGFNIPMFSQDINMTPEGQGLYDAQMRLSQGLLGLGNTSLDQTQATLGQPQDFGSVGDIADQSYGLQTSRLDPQWAANKEAFDAQMANQGLSPGGEAYDNAYRQFAQAQNDAYQQARLSSINTMPQTFQLEAARRLQPLTELNAIRSGAQPQMPTFQGVPAAGGAQGPQSLAAAQMQGQYDAAQNAAGNSMLNGIFGLAGTLGAAGINQGIFSDRRLKKNVKRIGTHSCGVGIYSYDIFGKRQVGVMADEVLAVRPEAVGERNGYMTVDYARL